MTFEYIDLIFDESGNVVYTSIPSTINQYATNYKIRVSFNSTLIKPKLIYASIFNGKTLPSRMLYKNSSEQINANGIIFKNPYVYQLTQYDTQTYQNELLITINIVDKSDTVLNKTISIVMNKSNFSKISPIELEQDSSLESAVIAIYNLSDQIITLQNKINELEGRINGN